MIAFHSETDIENELSKDPDRLLGDEMREALRRIDRLQESGDYEVEVERLKTKLSSERPVGVWESLSEEQLQYGAEIDAGLLNFFDGLRSPDSEQRKRFEALFDKIKEMSLHETKEVLDCLEQAKKPRGRKPGSANPGDLKLLIEMKVLVRKGASVRAAALTVAERTPTGGTLESRAKRLERSFLIKMNLRNKLGE